MFVFGNDWNNVGLDIYWVFEFFFGIRMGENVWVYMIENDNVDGSGIIDF